MHICFVALNAYNLFTQSKVLTHIGGAEIQQYLMARWLVENGHQITVVTLDHGQHKETHASGIRIIKSYKVEEGYPVLRFFSPRWKNLVATLADAEADIYYQRGAGVETGQVAEWCRRHNKPFVFSTASDGDCQASLPFLASWRDKFLYRLGLKWAQVVIVQSQHQARMLEHDFNRKGQVLYSSGRELGQPYQPGKRENRVIWVGRFSPEKRFEWVIEIAKKCPNYQFDIVGASNNGSSYAASMMTQAQQVPNINLVGHVPMNEVGQHYNEARFLLLTSPLEGFPNVFLEAWQLGVPVITSFDPDHLVETHGLGWIIDNTSAAQTVLDRFAKEPEGLIDIGSRCVDFYDKNHTISKNMPKFVNILQNTFAHTGREDNTR